MAGRRANEALASFVAHLERAIAGFAENQRIVRLSPSREIGGPGLTTPGGDPVPLRDSDRHVCLGLALRLRYRIVEDRRKGVARVEAIAYSYQLERSDPAGEPPHELLRFDWHRYVPNTPRPHVHVGEALAGAGVVISERMHIPTGGFVTLKDALEHAVADYSVVPLRADWKDRLDVAHKALMASLAWADPRA